jgi:hypothetical protein
MARNENSGLSVTKNCVLAVSLDMKKKTERIIIGELEDVRRHIRGFPHRELYYLSDNRDLGQLLMDYKPIADVAADIRAALIDSVGKKKSPRFGWAVDTLAEHYNSNNPIYQFTALLMWQEYHRAKRDKKAAESLFDTFYDITLALRFNDTLALRFNVLDSVKDWQVHSRSNPLRFSDYDFRKFPVTIYFSDDKDTSEYALTDRSPLAICFYYLKRVYDSGRYIQTCPICERPFIAKTAGMRTLCSDACRRVQGRENKRRHDERAKGVSYERASKTAYMYWYNKMVKLRGMGLPEQKMDKAERMFKEYTDEAARWKKAVAKKKSDVAEFEAWLLSQRDVIDELMNETNRKS